MRSHHFKTQTAAGFSLIELLLTLSIVLLVGGYALHGGIDISREHKINGLQETFINLLFSARNAAITHNAEVIVCPVDTARTTATDRPSCGKRNNWHLGVLAFADINSNRHLDNDEAIVAQLPSFSGVSIRWRAFRNRSYLRFTPQGLTDWQNGNFLFCAAVHQPQLARQVTINHAGRLYTAEDYDLDGVFEGRDRLPLVCD